MNELSKALAGVVAGGLIGWMANALTLVGRVTAIEQSLVRIEARLDNRAAAPATAQHLEARQ